MKVAVPTDGKYVASHFGRCPSFTMAEIEAGKVTSKTLVPSPGHDCAALPLFLKKNGVSCVIAGGMGAGAQQHMKAEQINVVFVSGGHVDEVLELYATELLKSGATRCTPDGGSCADGHGNSSGGEGHGHHHSH
jgi:predicted Fe-Mo cluster-binding NifX family protein